MSNDVRKYIRLRLSSCNALYMYLFDKVNRERIERDKKHGNLRELKGCDGYDYWMHLGNNGNITVISQKSLHIITDNKVILQLFLNKINVN